MDRTDREEDLNDRFFVRRYNINLIIAEDMKFGFHICRITELLRAANGITWAEIRNLPEIIWQAGRVK